MLERATRCVENAGEHFIQRCAAGIRTRRALRPEFWRHGALEVEVSLHALINPSHRHAYDNSQPFAKSPTLEFLYPPRTQVFAGYYRRKSQHAVFRRRRRKSVCRGYSSLAEQNNLEELGDTSTASEDPSAEGRQSGSFGSKQGAPQSLGGLLEAKDIRQYDEAWRLFETGGRSQEYASKVLFYISDSEAAVDLARCETIFDSIPVDKRNETDYWCMVKAALRAGWPSSRVTDLCKEAISLKKGDLCWSIALAAFVNRMNWDAALDLWKYRRPPRGQIRLMSLKFAGLLTTDTLPERVFELLNAIESGRLALEEPGVTELTTYIVHDMVSSMGIMMEMTLASILQLFQRLVNLQLIEAELYFTAMTTLLSSEARSATTRSVLLYRNFRWRMASEIVSQAVLMSFMKRLCALKMPDAVEYFLDEFRFFHQRPPGQAYCYALTTFARLGDVSKVEQLFECLVSDHGPPSDLRLLTPLLYVHARLGQVQETASQLRRLSKDFHVSPNVVCWNILLTAHVNARNLHGAASTFRDMSRAGIEPDSHSYGILMGLIAKRGDVEAVKTLLSRARRHRVILTSPMVDTLVEVLCKNKSYAEAEEAIHDALKTKPELKLTRTFNILLWNYAFAADIDGLARVQTQMQKLGITFDSMTYAALMLSLTLIHDTDSAVRILRKLHQTQRIHANQFHYSIILHGYMKERNRDMVYVIYREMIERFDDPGPSANLTRLRALIQRDIQRSRETGDEEFGEAILAHSTQFLESIMEDFGVSDYALSFPQPGGGGRRLQDAFPSAYYEFLISASTSVGANDKAAALFEEYSRKASKLSDPKSPPLQLRYVLMESHLRRGLHKQVESNWEDIFRSMVDLSKSVDINNLLPSTQHPIADQPSGESRRNASGAGQNPSVLSYFRFSLSQCLSVYIRSLANQERWAKINDVLRTSKEAGFVVTSENLSLYIKLLAFSRTPEQQLQAFVHFEKNYMDNFPGWKYIRRSFAKLPGDAPAGLHLRDNNPGRGKRPDLIAKTARLAWQRLRPDYMQPTYVTMIYLASALIDFRTRSVVDGGRELDALLSKAPRTVLTLAELPFLREKFQKILLRDERHQEPSKRGNVDTSSKTIWTGGVLGVNGETSLDKRQTAFGHDSVELKPSQTEAWEQYSEHDGDTYYRNTLGADLDRTRRKGSQEVYEPDAETLESLFAEDAVWRRRVARRATPAEEMPPASLLQRQDEQDLEYESQLAKESSNKPES